MPSTREIRKELAILIEKKKAACTTQQQENRIVEHCLSSRTLAQNPLLYAAKNKFKINL